MQDTIDKLENQIKKLEATLAQKKRLLKWAMDVKKEVDSV